MTAPNYARTRGIPQIDFSIDHCPSGQGSICVSNLCSARAASPLAATHAVFVLADLIRPTCGATFTVEQAAHSLDLSEADTEAYIQALVEAGHVERETGGNGRDGPAWYSPTRLAISLRKAKKTKRITRSEASRAAAALLVAIKQVNDNTTLIPQSRRQTFSAATSRVPTTLRRRGRCCSPIAPPSGAGMDRCQHGASGGDGQT